MDTASWMDEVAAKLGERPAIFEGKGVKVEGTASGVNLSAAAEMQSESVRAAGTSFPFKVVKGEASGTVLVMGCNADAGRLFKDTVTLGLSTHEVPETIVENISSDCWIYLNITYSGDAYSLELKKSSELPGQSVTEYNIPIAFVKASGGVVGKIGQMQYGPIQGAGRIF